MEYTVYGILQARILEWVAFPFPGDLSNPGIEPRSPTLQAESLLSEPPGKPKNTGVHSLSLLQGIFWPRNQTGVSCIAGRFFSNWAIREADRRQILKYDFIYSFIFSHPGSSLLCGLFSSCSELGSSLIEVHGLLIAVASLAEHGLWGHGLQSL